jgi:hypothetical protein
MILNEVPVEMKGYKWVLKEKKISGSCFSTIHDIDTSLALAIVVSSDEPIYTVVDEGLLLEKV